MIDKKDEALKLALEALRDYRRSDDDRVSVAMGILQEALAEQPAQQQELSNGDVEFVDSLGATRKALSDCQGHVRNLRMKGVTYWPLEANDEKLLSDAECGRGEFTRPGAATIEAMVAAMQQLQNEVYALRNKQQSAERGEPVALPCCGFTDASAVKWNHYNQVVQCHNCGRVYTTPQPAQQQEPVALSQAVYTVLEGFTLPHDVRKILESAYYSDQPASKPWVGLTPAEVHDIWCFNHTPQEVCDAVSAKLREKNQ